MTAITRIVDWVNQDARPVWVRHALRLLIDKNELEEQDYTSLFRLARKEAGFNEELEIEEYSEHINADGYGVEEHPVALMKLGPMTHVGSVPDSEILAFSETGMTVIYGNNGSGKSSYARVLKNACLTRGEKPPVLSNIFEDELQQPEAVIEYKVGDGSVIPITWSLGGEEAANLKAIRVFDTKSANHYVEKEDRLSYKPAGLHFLDELGRVCTFVVEQARLGKDRNRAPVQLPALDEGTAAYAFIQGLSENTTLEEIEAQDILVEEIAELETLPNEIARLTITTPEKLRFDLGKKRARLVSLSTSISNALFAVCDTEVSRIENLRGVASRKYEVTEQARKEAFSDIEIGGVGSASWNKLWASAKTFSETEVYPEQSFPVTENAKCPLCIQDIENEAGARLEGFQAFVDSPVQQDFDAAFRVFETERGRLVALNLELEDKAAAISEVKETIEDFDSSLADLYQVLEERRIYLSLELGANRDDLDISQIGTVELEKLSVLIMSINYELQAVQGDEGLAELIEQRKLRQKELNGKKLITDNKEAIRKEISRRKAIKLYKDIERTANTRPLTQLATEINRIYVTSQLETNFQEELDFFGFKYFDVSTKTRGDRGNQKFSLEIVQSDKAPLIDIASEGEAKCFALSGALSELRTDNRMSGVVFDDPVNSMDHKWTERAAKRLVKESGDRQVIIFTHDIVFLKFLCEASEATDDYTLVIKSLDRSRHNTGIVRSNPPWDALTTSKRVKYLKSVWRELRQIDRDGTEAEYDDRAAKFYGLLREAWERLVEEKLLNKVVQRFSRDVPTQRLRRLIDIEQSDIDRVGTAMTKCSALLDGHDHAAGVYQNMPTVDEAMADIRDIEGYLAELNGRNRS